MNCNFYKWFYYISWNNLYIISGVLFLITLALWSKKSNRRASAKNIYSGNAGERKVISLIKRNIPGLPILRGFAFLPGGKKSNSTQIDAIIKGVDRLWILEVKNWTGYISGSKNDRDWTIRGKTIWKTVNPLVQLNRQRYWLNKEVGVPVDGFVVMSGSATTNGSWPYGVVIAEDISRIIAGKARNQQGCGASSDAVDRAWKRVVELRKIDSYNNISASHTQRMENKPNKSNFFPLILIIIVVGLIIGKLISKNFC